MSTYRLLISFAHPDDESFGLGGLIAKYVEAGVEVYLICATNGDVGTIAEEHMQGFETVKEVRLAELECADKILKFTKIFRLGYKDSGMMGSETSKDPECLWSQYENYPEAVTRRVVEVIREIKPHVVITFNKYGGYGHPDHIAIQSATTDAFDLAGDSDFITDSQAPYQPQKLYYNAFPAIFLRIGVAIMRLKRQDPRAMGRNKDIDLQAILDHIEPTHVKVDIRQYYDIWDQANACHKSQGGGSRDNILQRLRKFISPHQRLTRVYPAPQHNKTDESDLFQGVNLDEKQAVLE